MENERYERMNRLAEAPEMTAREVDEAFAVCVETVKRNMAYFGSTVPAAASVERCGSLTRRRGTPLLSGKPWPRWQTLNGV